MNKPKEFTFDLTNASLDTLSFTDAVNLLYVEPVELLQSIYNEMTDAGVPDVIAIPATKKAFLLTRDCVTDTLQKVIANQADISEWGV
ncbi:MAG: hypothetical protein KIB48_12585 [Enterobacter cloacae]|nr:hypothetical protein [Enterobacter cloacae]